MMGRIEKRVDLGNGHPLRRFSHFHDRVASAYLAFSKHAEVKSRPAAGGQQGRHSRLVHADADAIAGHTRLGDLEHGPADLVAIADAHHIVGQTFNREVLAELTVDEVGSLQLLLPVAIRFNLVDEDSALLTAVPGQITLAVPVEIQSANAAAAAHRVLPDPGVYRASLPLDIARQSNVHRYKPCHVTPRSAVRRYWRSRASSTLRSRSGPCGITV